MRIWTELGASPAELDHNPEGDRPMSWSSHDAEAELRIYEDNADE